MSWRVAVRIVVPLGAAMPLAADADRCIHILSTTHTGPSGPVAPGRASALPGIVTAGGIPPAH